MSTVSLMTSLLTEVVQEVADGWFCVTFVYVYFLIIFVRIFVWISLECWCSMSAQFNVYTASDFFSGEFISKLFKY